MKRLGLLAVMVILLLLIRATLAQESDPETIFITKDEMFQIVNTNGFWIEETNFGVCIQAYSPYCLTIFDLEITENGYLLRLETYWAILRFVNTNYYSGRGISRNPAPMVQEAMTHPTLPQEGAHWCLGRVNNNLDISIQDNQIHFLESESEGNEGGTLQDREYTRVYFLNNNEENVFIILSRQDDFGRGNEILRYQGQTSPENITVVACPLPQAEMPLIKTSSIPILSTNQ